MSCALNREMDILVEKTPKHKRDDNDKTSTSPVKRQKQLDVREEARRRGEELLNNIRDESNEIKEEQPE